jgi:hypothetical protein
MIRRFDILALAANSRWSASCRVAILTVLCNGFLCPSASYGQQQSVSLPVKEKFHLFLLVGQSNMAGRGKVGQQDRKPHARVVVFSKQGKWNPAVDPLHFDKPGVVGVGLGKSFGIHIAADDPDITVGLIPCAAGGSPLASWEPGGYHGQTKSHPWDDALRRARAAMKDGTLKGILWHQGESDAKDGLAAVYEKKLHALIRRFREELPAEHIPFIAGQLGQFPDRPWDVFKRQVDLAHRHLPDKVARTAFVDSDGLSHKGDQVHFDAASYRHLGSRYAEAYLHLTKDENSTSDLWFRIERTVAHRGFDGKMCWVHARAGIVPNRDRTKQPLVVMTMQKLLLSGSDVFYALNQTLNDGNGQWTPPRENRTFDRQLIGENREMTVCDFTPQWHAKTSKLLGIGHTVVYQDNRVMHVRPRSTAFAVFDSSTKSWGEWQLLVMPSAARFQNAGAGSVQRYDLPNGEILLPIYFKEPSRKQYTTTVLRCRFDGEKLEYIEHGSELTIPVKRGLYEPSVTKFQGRYFLTMRNDDDGYVSISNNGIDYSKPRKWTFDDGTILGNYNTQQHWVTHRRGLYLVYTRKGANNDHVFRHRAPLFIARVDPQSLQLVRSTERILVHEAGARLGNFGVVDVSQDETWVTVTEWMQPTGVEKHGSDNRVHVVKLHWNRLNDFESRN